VWDAGHPYRLRTWLRGHLPWFLIHAGVVNEGKDCERADGWHHCYKIDNERSGCYHCEVIRPGQLWKNPGRPD